MPEHPPELKQKHAPLSWGINKGIKPILAFVKPLLAYFGILARPESEPKTPLGHRLRDIRRHFGDEERDVFAKRLGLSTSALARYERGEVPPDSLALTAYHDIFGINLHWLLTGTGEMFADPSKAPPPVLDQNLMAKLARLISKAHKELGIGDSSENIAGKAAGLYNELSAMVQDIRDEEETEAALQYLAVSYKKRIRARHPHGQTPGEKTAS